MHEAMKRVEELKQETIEKSKKIPNSEAIVMDRLRKLSIVITAQTNKPSL